MSTARKRQNMVGAADVQEAKAKRLNKVSICEGNNSVLWLPETNRGEIWLQNVEQDHF
jgi:hypothetical protein